MNEQFNHITHLLTEMGSAIADIQKRVSSLEQTARPTNRESQPVDHTQPAILQQTPNSCRAVINPPNLRSTNPAINSLLVEASEVINQALAPNTRKAYNRAWEAFRIFTATTKAANPYSQSTILAFTTHCHLGLKLSPTSIKAFLAGIQHHHALLYPSHPSILSYYSVKLFLRGISNSQLLTPRTRLPITGHIFRRIYDFINTKTFQAQTNIVIQAAVCLAFFGFLRPSEFSSRTRSDDFVRKDQLAHHSDHFTLFISHSKTDQSHTGHYIPYFATNDPWCPYKALTNLTNLIHLHPNDSPLLPLLSGPLTTSSFIYYVRIILSRLGYNPNDYSGHSFRIGAASAASRNQVPAHIIQRLGRWQSACFSRYIPNPDTEICRALTNLAK
ncbi:uncharacterized protein WCC33_016415 [Rhinophrynus dorsalis]